MAGNAFARESIRLALMAVMGGCLALTLVIGTATLIWSAPPYGDTLRLIAAVFAWIFTAAFFMSFILAVVDERKMSRGKRAGDAEGAKV
jgi:hypothetical protein